MCYFTNFSETENNALANTLFSECTEFIYILNRLSLYMGCRASQVTQMVKNLPALWKTHVPSLGQEDPGRGCENLPQYSCLENPMDRGAWGATVHGITKESDTT